MTVLFCDDDTTFLNTIMKRTEKELSTRHVESQLIACTSGTELFEQMGHKEVDVIFLDIDMPGMTGFHIAEKVGKAGDAPIIIFVSNMDHLVFESFFYNPFWFLRKTDLAQLPIIVEKILIYLRTTKHMFRFAVSGQELSVSVKDIFFFESNDHYVIVYTTTTNYKFKASISEISKQLANYHFVRTHIGFLVNCQYIAAIRKSSLQLTTGAVIPIARNRAKEVQEAFIEYTRSVHI